MNRRQSLVLVLPDVAVVYLLVVVWEFVSTPNVSPSDPSAGLGVSVMSLALGAIWISWQSEFRSWAFTYGVGGSLLFVYRFVHMDRFGQWLNHSAPSSTAIGAYWVLFALGMGVLCWLAAFTARQLKA